MSLQEQVKADTIAAMKSKDKETVSLLRVLSGEFGRVKDENGNSVKVVTDDEATEVIRKMVKNAKGLDNMEEVGILSKYLPVMLGEMQVKTIVAGIIQKNGYSEMRDMGKVMGTLKTHPMTAQIDGKLASQITRDLLTQ